MKRHLPKVIVIPETAQASDAASGEIMFDALTTDVVSRWADEVMSIITTAPKIDAHITPVVVREQDITVDREIERLRKQLRELEAKKAAILIDT